MGLEKFASIIGTALSQLATSSSSGSSVLPPLGPTFRSAWAGHGKAAGLRLSSSLQDFSTYRKAGPENSGVVLEVVDGSSRTKSPFLSSSPGGNSFSKEKILPLTSSKSCQWTKLCAMFFLFLILIILSIFLFGWLKPHWSNDMPQYSIVLDCGSTGTRIFVYEWIHNHAKDQGNLPLVLHPFPESADPSSKKRNGRAYHRMETEPGLDKLLHNESGLRGAIEPLIHWAAKQIPSYAHENTPLFLLATAGLRRLPPSDSKWVLDRAWSILEESPFMCQRSWVKIITGVEEAYYGWVALNYIMNRLGNVPTKETFGALDLGGSSLQVTFETKGMTHRDFGLNLSIGTAEHFIDAYSLAGYGLNDAFEKSVILLLREKSSLGMLKYSNGVLQLKHPCLHTGYRQKYNCPRCSSVIEGGSPLVAGRDMDQKTSNPVIQLIGEPNWDKCEVLALSTVNSSEWVQASPGLDCKQSSCAISNNQPQPKGQFYAMSGFYVVYNFFNLTSGASFDDVLVKGQDYCAKSWKDAVRSVLPQPFIEQYCFRAPYLVSLLRYGLHLKDDQVIVGSGSITWTLGAAFMEAGSLFLRKMKNERQTRLSLFNTNRFEMDTTTLTVVLFALFIMLIFLASVIRKGILKVCRRPHLPLFGQYSSLSPISKFQSPYRPQMRSPMNNGPSPNHSDGKAKIPLSPSSFQQQFGVQSHICGSTQHNDSIIYQSPVSFGMSISSENLGQLQSDMWTPHRGQTRLQSRRSQSREDLCQQVSETHIIMM